MPSTNHRDVGTAGYSDDYTVDTTTFHSINGDSIHRVEFDPDTKEVISRYSGKNINPRVTVGGKPKALSFGCPSGSSIIKAGDPWIKDQVEAVHTLLADTGEDSKLYQMNKKATETLGSLSVSRALPSTSRTSLSAIKPGEIWTEDHMESVHSLIANDCENSQMYQMFSKAYEKTRDWDLASQAVILALNAGQAVTKLYNGGNSESGAD